MANLFRCGGGKSDELSDNLKSFFSYSGVEIYSKFEFTLTDDFIETYNLVDLLGGAMNNGDYELSEPITNFECILIYDIYKDTLTSVYNCVHIYARRAMVLNTAYVANLRDENTNYTKYATFTSNKTVTISGKTAATMKIFGIK